MDKIIYLFKLIRLFLVPMLPGGTATRNSYPAIHPGTDRTRKYGNFVFSRISASNDGDSHFSRSRGHILCVLCTGIPCSPRSTSDFPEWYFRSVSSLPMTDRQNNTRSRLSGLPEGWEVLVDGTGTGITVVTVVDGISKTRCVPLSGTVCVQPQLPAVTNKNRITSGYRTFMGSPGFSRVVQQ